MSEGVAMDETNCDANENVPTTSPVTANMFNRRSNAPSSCSERAHSSAMLGWSSNGVSEGHGMDETNCNVNDNVPT